MASKDGAREAPARDCWAWPEAPSTSTKTVSPTHPGARHVRPTSPAVSFLPSSPVASRSKARNRFSASHMRPTDPGRDQNPPCRSSFAKVCPGPGLRRGGRPHTNQASNSWQRSLASGLVSSANGSQHRCLSLQQVCGLWHYHMIPLAHRAAEESSSQEHGSGPAMGKM